MDEANDLDRPAHSPKQGAHRNDHEEPAQDVSRVGNRARKALAERETKRGLPSVTDQPESGSYEPGQSPRFAGGREINKLSIIAPPVNKALYTEIPDFGANSARLNQKRVQ